MALGSSAAGPQLAAPPEAMTPVTLAALERLAAALQESPDDRAEQPLRQPSCPAAAENLDGSMLEAQA